MIVADTNLVSYLVIEGTWTEAARRVWARDPEWVLPPLWRSEFLNVLALSVRGRVLTEVQARTAWQVASGLFARAEREPTGEAVLEAALRFEISAYDAHFVVVAQELRAPLVTGDRRLLKACPRIAVALGEFGAA